MREQGITDKELAARLDIPEYAVRGLREPNRFSNVSHVERALKAIGISLVVENMDAGLTKSSHNTGMKERDTVPTA